MRPAALPAILLTMATPAPAQFGPPQEVTQTVVDPVDVRSADVDGDGDLDLLTASESDPEVFWFENTGGGLLGGRQLVAALDEPNCHALQTGDLDGDGDPDVVAASGAPYRVVLIENLGGGSFGTPQELGVLPTPVSRIELGDLDGDGALDILVASITWLGQTGCVCWLRNLGGGSFALNTITPGSPAGDAHPADLDGDGDLDIAVADPTQNAERILWLENLGGTFSSANVLDSGVNPVDVHVADLDGDGDGDILSLDDQASTLGWYENLGSGNFTALHVIDASANLDPTRVDAGDLDGDGDLDVVYSDRNHSGEFLWRDNLGSGTFGPAIAIDELRHPVGVELADHDGDGDPDLLATSLWGAVGWYQNVGAGSPSGFGLFQEAAFRAATVHDVRAADLDGDGDRDVLSASPEDGKVAWYENPGSGAFEPRVLGVQEGAFRVRSADLTGDGASDVVGLGYPPGTLHWYENQGGGSFAAGVLVADVDGFDLELLDVDVDGDIDVLVPERSSIGSLVWFENDGTGAFGPAQILGDSPGASFVDLEVGDLDGDGDDDIAVLSLGYLRWLRNRGGGSFAEVEDVSHDYLGEAGDVVLTDADLDGDVDLVFSADPNGCLWWSENLGGVGNFAPETLITDPSAFDFFWLLHAADMDADGDPDLLTTRSATDEIGYVENLGGGSWAPAVVVHDQYDDYRTTWTGDLDLDGDPDVISAVLSLSRVVWFENSLPPSIGTRFCDPAVPNSTGKPGKMTVLGSAVVADDALTLRAHDLPASPNIGYFLMGTGTNTFMPAGSSGFLCIAPGLQRYLPPVNDTSQFPGGFDRVVGTQGNGHPVSAAITPGSTWNFQAWHRDSMAATSNFTDAVSVTFQ